MDEMIELLPCPHCGGAADYQLLHEIGVITCSVCWATVSAVRDEETDEETVARWNRREPAGDKIKLVDCEAQLDAVKDQRWFLAQAINANDDPPVSIRQLARSILADAPPPDAGDARAELATAILREARAALQGVSAEYGDDESWNVEDAILATQLEAIIRHARALQEAGDE